LTGAVQEDWMRMLISLLVIAYLVGVGVVLAPTIKANWTTAPASEFVDSIIKELPRALSWPAAAYHSLAEDKGASERPAAAEKPAAVKPADPEKPPAY
jgi:hypothetical protein